MRYTVPVILFLYFLLPQAKGQYIFENLKPKDGLSSREVYSVLQDSEGFMWMGTMNGLNRFDGSRFLVWNHRINSYPLLLGEEVYAITEYSKGHIWFGTNSGVGVLDKATRAIIEVKVESAGKRPFVTQFSKGRDGRLLMITHSGLYVYLEGVFKPISALYPYAAELDSVACHHGGFLYDTLRNVYWIASLKGMYCLDPGQKQLFSQKNNPGNLPFYNTNLLNSVAIDRKGSMWYGDGTLGALGHFDFINGKLEIIRNINNNPVWELDGGCNKLFIDREDRLWISSWLYASFIRYPDGRFEKIPYDDKLPYSIGYGLIYDAIQDSHGNIWLGTLNGVSKLTASRFVENIIHIPTDAYYLPITISNVDAMEFDDKGNMWMAKLEGLVKRDASTAQFELFVPFPGGKQANSLHDIDIIDGEIWCASGNGIIAFDPLSRKFRNVIPAMGRTRPRLITNVYPDRHGYIWIVSWRECVIRYDRRTKTFTRFDGRDTAWGNFNPDFSSSMLETSDNKLWISNSSNGIMAFDYESQKFYRLFHPLLNKSIYYSMVEDNDRNVWCSTRDHALLKFDLTGRLLDSINIRDALPLTRYDDLTIDKMGRIWTRSRTGLWCIQPASKQITKVNIDVVFSFNDHWNWLQLIGGKLYATMLDNVVVLNPEKFRQDVSIRSPLIAGFQVFQNEIPFHPEKTIRLSYNQNFFSIDFSSPSHLEDAFIEYAYKLDGFDKDWVYSGKGQTAAYTNVPDGNYTFLLKTKDGSGKWSDAVTSLSIYVAPPFWKTWWFITMAILLLCMIVYSLYQRRIKRQQRIEIEKTIDYFANSVYGENSVNEICWDIARNCISQLLFEDCVVYLLDKKTNRLVQKAAYGPKNPKGHEIINPIEIEPGTGIVGAVALTGKPLLVNDTTKDKRYIVDDVQRLSELAVPILHDSKVIGVIDSEHSQKNFFTEEHLKAMMTIASISSNKIAEAQAEEYAKENEIKLLEINKMLAESQLMALRAQMNPHFVFNCLNSIQECIVTRKYGEASKYLNKFSKLFRTVLNNSGKNLVSLEEEKEVLELYLELEQMRFEKSFTYEMVIADELEADDMLLPSMLLQPYVENALWHGLMHKEGERNLAIRFEKVNEEVFRCTIDDNGIGRKQSFALKGQQSKAKRHESKGLRISKDRIDVLQKQGYHARLDIIDKYDWAGLAEGTTVIIELSNYLKN